MKPYYAFLLKKLTVLYLLRRYVTYVLLMKGCNYKTRKDFLNSQYTWQPNYRKGYKVLFSNYVITAYLKVNYSHSRR